MGDGLGLASPVPFILANLVWAPAPDGLRAAADWCAARGLPPAVASAPGGATDAALAADGFAPSHAFGADDTLPPEDGPTGAEVPWDRAIEAAELFAAHFQRPEIAEPLAPLLASAVHDDMLECRLAFDGPTAVGSILAASNAQHYLVLLDAGRSGTLVRDAHLEARAHGRRAARWRELDGPDDPAATLRRWERP